MGPDVARRQARRHGRRGLVLPAVAPCTRLPHSRGWFRQLGVAEGHSNTAIARTLVVTPGAVEKHTQHIFAKLGLAQDEDQHRRVMATLAYLRG
ncbi:MAG TPA: LuxR C-terminal-related transcriptional regulator [Blastococcus sp.]